MEKPIIIVPDFGAKVHEAGDFAFLYHVASETKREVRVMDIDWSPSSTVIDWAASVNKQLVDLNLETENTTIVGLAMGAVVTAHVITAAVFEKAVLCSPLPCFNEFKATWDDDFKKRYSEEQIKAFASGSLEGVASRSMTGPVHLLHGARGNRLVSDVAMRMFKFLPGLHTTKRIIEESDDTIGHLNYREAIQASL